MGEWVVIVTLSPASTDLLLCSFSLGELEVTTLHSSGTFMPL